MSFSKAVVEGSVTRSGLQDVYTDWADTYDQAITDTNRSKILSAGQLASLLGDKKDSKILDVCAGTGLVGEELHKLGLCNLDALDFSSEMLEKARQKNLYHQLICDSLGANKTQVADDTYDALICVGSFAAGHLLDDCLPELIRITKPGGYIVIGFREEILYTCPEYKDILEPAMQRLHDSCRWKWLSRTVRTDMYPDKNGVISSFQVL